MSLHLQPDWLPLVGEFVEIRLAGQPIRTGTVDAVTTDNSILWLAADGGYLRAMVERTEGCEVWIRYKWEKRAGQPDMPASGGELTPQNSPTENG